VPSVEAAGPGDASEYLARILALVLERSPRTLTELAEVVGTTAMQAAPLVDALERHGLVAWDAARTGLRPGPVELRFARSGVGRQDLIELAQPALRRLAAESGETVNLFVPGPRGTEAIAQIDGSHLLGATNWLERELPLHATAAGKVLLAFGAAALGERPPERLTPATIADHAALEAELDKVRTVGYATLVDELEEGLSAVAAPVREHDGAVVGALTISGATLRLPAHRLALLGRVALEQAHTVSTSLGHVSALEDVLG
jgi:IclR family transcriptional regulator, acetate operon repressor